MDDPEGLAAAVRACRDCPLGVQGLGVYGAYMCDGEAVEARPDGHAEIMFVGEGPGREEQRRGLPFCGPSGALLHGLIAQSGITGVYYVTNLVKHRPWVKEGKQQPPEAEHIAACRGFLEAELRLVRPKVVVLLGKTAAKVLTRVWTPKGNEPPLTGNFAMKDTVNRWFGHPAYPGVRFVPLYHPAHFLYNEGEPYIVRQMNDFRRALAEAAGIKAPEYRIEYVPCAIHHDDGAERQVGSGHRVVDGAIYV